MYFFEVPIKSLISMNYKRNSLISTIKTQLSSNISKLSDPDKLIQNTVKQHNNNGNRK